MSKSTADEILNKLNEIVEQQAKELAGWREELAGIETVHCEGGRIVPPTIFEAVETIVANKSANKYLFSILLTCCIKKLFSPEQDIRIAQENMGGGYSNRSFDQRIVTQFLKRHGYTHCEASGLESGRNFERPLPWDLNYPANPRGAGNREAFLGILNYIEDQNGNAEAVAGCLMYLDRQGRVLSERASVPPRENQIGKIMRIFERHFTESSGQGKSRLPVLALYAIYQSLVMELERYTDAELLTLERHTTADLRSGSIGDIQLDKGGEPFEGVEVKSEKPITASMVRELPRKFSGRKVSRYYILSTCLPYYVLEKDQESVERAVREVETETGSQVIANGLIRTLWYYLRLLKDPADVLPAYKDLLESDLDIRPELIDAWNKILEEEF